MIEAADEQPAEKAGAPPWMATFADMMSLLLTFFVLLLSFANMDIVKFRDAMGSLQDAFGVKIEDAGVIEGTVSQVVELSETESRPEIEIEQPEAPPPPEPGPSAEELREQKLQEDLSNEASAAIARSNLGGLVEAVPGDRGVTIRVKDALMFRSGSDELRRASKSLLDEIVALARRFPHNISVEGHTDRVPIQTEEFPSNWHLSAARAVAGLMYLVKEGGIPAERLNASGFGSTRPLVPETSDEARKRNRRLEFVFYREDEKLETVTEIDPAISREQSDLPAFQP